MTLPGDLSVLLLIDQGDQANLIPNFLPPFLLPLPHGTSVVPF